MTVGYTTAAIHRLFNTVAAAMPSAVFAGSYGDKPGYHNCRANLGPGDYSVQTPPDRLGDPQAGAALDITYRDPAEQYAASSRLLAAKYDPRMYPIREFFGSVDGITVCGWDYYGWGDQADGYPVSSDDSHLWHVHLSILRQYTEDDAALQAVADVITGSSGGGPDMANRVQVSRSTAARLAAGAVIDLAWDVQEADPGGVFYGTGDVPAGGSRARLDLGGSNGRLYVSTFMATVNGLADGSQILSGLTYCDSAGNNVGNSPMQQHLSNGGPCEVVDSRVGRAAPERGIKIRLKPAADVTLDGARWTVLYFD